MELDKKTVQRLTRILDTWRANEFVIISTNIPAPVFLGIGGKGRQSNGDSFHAYDREFRFSSQVKGIVFFCNGGHPLSGMDVPIQCVFDLQKVIDEIKENHVKGIVYSHASHPLNLMKMLYLKNGSNTPHLL